ncbi:heme-copper oxidase subunit III [Phototrophicus methaneseepsis]|uniref:Heme-copper oxidase subunit III n=1 Tax=Phototrophicus methaneseepsis TaxID=2710758 RepID=A0A7S8IGS0_9CHLR|nr:cytochrome c oxidase subunit 3 [Phototrophicus methaneseepsis]QPC84388.1 heme-copper oxidase subunit III [Phototrophicus methaneseepsis]
MANVALSAEHHEHGAHHYDDVAEKNNNKKLAMWLYLASEIVIFSIMIVGYAIYRLNEPLAISNIHESLGIVLVTINTFLLLTSSWAMVMGLRAIEMGNRTRFMQWIGLTALLGAVFIGGQWMEYRELANLNLALQRTDITLQDEIFHSSLEIEEVADGYQVTVLNPALVRDLELSFDTERFNETTVLTDAEYTEFNDALTDDVVDATANFGMRFYAPTAFHGAHVVIGVLLALHVLYLGSKGFYDDNSIGVELFGLYWHFVDVVWILLFTLIYLV